MPVTISSRVAAVMYGYDALLPGVMLPVAHRQCIHTEIQKSTCIIFCISCYMYHMYHMYESAAILAQAFILPIASQAGARTELYRS